MTGHANWGAVVFDSNDPQRLGQFWSDAFGYSIETSSPGWVLLRHPDPGRRFPLLAFQGINRDVQHGAETSQGNRAHLDTGPVVDEPLTPAQIENEVCRLEALGARRVHTVPEDAAEPLHWIMTDPDGNVFCVAG